MTKQILSADQAMARAKQLANAGNHAEAADLYQQILANNPKNKKAGKALKALHKSTQGANRMSRLQADMGKLMQLYNSGMYDQAFSQAAHLTHVYPEQPVPPNIMGVIQASRGENKAAVSSYEKALAIDPNFIDAIGNLGHVSHKLGDHERAIACFQKLIAISPKDADNYYNLGNVLFDASKLDHAIMAYEKSIAVRPLHSLSHYRLGLALEAANKPIKQALASYRNAIDINPKMVEAHVSVAEAYQSMYQPELAIAWFRDAMRLQPDSKAANRGVARALLLSGKSEEAIAAYQQCLNLEPGSQEMLYFLNAAKNISPDMPPKEYVQNLFDSYAHRFERHLSDTLGYRGPELLHQLIMDSGAIDNQIASAIDLGCGTGLSGAAFEDICDSIVGVDLSRKMLQKAEAKGCYTALHHGEVSDIVEQLNTVFDLYIAADTLIYMGNLERLFSTIGRHAKTGTLFAFTTELGSEEDFQLLPSGRYAHSSNYIERIATGAGFTMVAAKEQELRKERDSALTGGFYLLRYKETS